LSVLHANGAPLIISTPTDVRADTVDKPGDAVRVRRHHSLAHLTVLINCAPRAVRGPQSIPTYCMRASFEESLLAEAPDSSREARRLNDPLQPPPS
jgi:hypothetical protein